MNTAHTLIIQVLIEPSRLGRDVINVWFTIWRAACMLIASSVTITLIHTVLPFASL